MVDIIRRKNADLVSPDVSSVLKAGAAELTKMGEAIGSATERYGRKIELKQSKADKEYQEQVKQNLKTEQARLVSEQKAFDASDKIVAADRIGRLKNDLLRWNLSQRENNPNYIGTPEHERAMRDEYSRLSSKYGAGLGEAGSAEFTEKTQSAVNDFISNDVKWAYRQKIKQGEESAKKIAETMNQNAAMYGANGDVEGFKEAHKEGREQLKDYINDVAPAGAAQALKELDRKSLIDFYTNLAQTDPVKAKALLDSMENFQTTVPDDMLQAANDTTTQAVNRDLNDKLIIVNAGIENTKKDRKQRKELEKQKKQIEKDIKKAQEEDYTEKSLGEIHKEVSDAVAPVLEKSLGESALIAKKEHEEEKVARFGEFMKLPTPENLKWFEEDNQMSYAKPEKNMSELPEDMKTQTQKNNELLENMMKYRENFGNVSMVEISDYKGTKQMFDDLKTLAQTDSDRDGNTDNVLLKGLVALNNAKQESISESDYNNYQGLVNKTIFDSSFKAELNDFIAKTENFMPKLFWDRPSNVPFTSNRARLNEKMESKSRDVLSSVIKEWNQGMSGEDATKMYRDGLQKAYNDVTSDALGINMEQILADYKQHGIALANINGVDYTFKGIDSNGNPLWDKVYAGGMSTQKLMESAKKLSKKGE